MSYLWGRRLVHTLAVVSLVWSFAAGASAQELPISTDRRNGDPNSAVIEGRVTLPSGFSAVRNIKIIVRNTVSILYTIHTNKNGEFRFHDLSEGIYYVQAEIDGGRLESAIEKVPLGRGIT